MSSGKKIAEGLWYSSKCKHSAEYSVVDDDGSNPGNASVKRCGKRWVYQDDLDGFDFIKASEVDRLERDGLLEERED